ncbi:unnamed protein product [Rotaria magnacalcarata]|uniref:Uncharacterized protein n=1 Tax=Rotaria magnacalcarata TaxID=392030 RepID=A0A816M1R3_9BILA|nr:unnamed protein product [Rotaria magnacalcarata]CAF2048299.1 unnamed protein product [Rotaria magnacalcarata]
MNQFKCIKDGLMIMTTDIENEGKDDGAADPFLKLRSLSSEAEQLNINDEFYAELSHYSKLSFSTAPNNPSSWLNRMNNTGVVLTVAYLYDASTCHHDACQRLPFGGYHRLLQRVASPAYSFGLFFYNSLMYPFH